MSELGDGGEAGECGTTFGVEEEFHLVDPDTLDLVTSPELTRQAAEHRLGANLRAEMLTSQLETATDVCTGLDELRSALVAGRREAAAAAARAGATLMAAGTHPSAPLSRIDVADNPRYDRLVERFGSIVRQFNLCGCHVHVGVPDLSTAVAIMSHARPYLPLLAALTAGSPFHTGADTGYESFRLAWIALWPQGGIPPRFESAAGYLAAVDRLVELGIAADSTELLWELRPSARYPTLEFRIADACADVDDAVLYAALARSLVRTLAARVSAGVAPSDLSDPELRAARWRASRYGLGSTLWSPARAQVVPAGSALDDLLAELRPDLGQHGEYAAVTELLAAVRSRGTSAQRQREAFAANGSLTDVTRLLVRITAAG
ncbi:MAG TPA: glutamate--cysteine ligase [Jatrophihabitantaceae bacterium]|nr:glutamate--cysteine ligase [Jatrophihabitantaceae bacterium]